MQFSSFLIFLFSICQNLCQALHIFSSFLLLSQQLFKCFVALLLLNHHSMPHIEKDHRPLQYSNEATPLSIDTTVNYGGESANAVPYSHKLCSRVPHIRGNRRLQLPLSAMRRSRPGGTALLITVSSEPGKYALTGLIFSHEINFPTFQPGLVPI